MKPASCVLCGKSASDEMSEKHGEWIEFADYDAMAVNSLSHPHGLEYFCFEHAPFAKKHSAQPLAVAMAALEQQFPRSDCETCSSRAVTTTLFSSLMKKLGL